MWGNRQEGRGPTLRGLWALPFSWFISCAVRVYMYIAHRADASVSLPCREKARFRQPAESFCLTDKKERSCQIKPSKPESKPRKTRTKPSKPESKPSKPENKHRKMQIKPSKLESKPSKQLSKL